MLNFKMQQSVIFSQRDAEMATLKKTGEQLEDLKLGPRFKSVDPKHLFNSLNMLHQGLETLACPHQPEEAPV